MIASRWGVVFITILTNCYFANCLDLEKTTAIPTDVSKSNNAEEYDDLISQQLLQNYQNGLIQLVQFFNSTNSFLATINNTLKSLDQKIQRLEQQVVFSTIGLSNEVQTLKTSVSHVCLQLKETMETTTPATTSITTTKTPTKPSTAEECLRSLPVAVKGKSFNGSTTVKIAEAVPGNWALAVEIANYLDVNLTDHELYGDEGIEHLKAPGIIFSKTREIFTFKSGGRIFEPYEVILYQVGDTRYSLHLIFKGDFRFAAGLFDDDAAVWTLESIASGCWRYTHTGTPGSFECTDRNRWETLKTFIIHKNSVYAKLSFNHKIPPQVEPEDIK